MKVSVEKVLKCWLAFKKIKDVKGSNKWAYGITKNNSKMQSEIDAIAASEKILQELDKERAEICKSLCDKDEAGNPVVENGNYIGIDEKDEKLVDCLDKMKKANDSHISLLLSEVDIDLYQIPFEEVPEMTPAIFSDISIVVAEPK